MSGPSVKELARITDPIWRRLAGMVRRVTVSLTTKQIWNAIGVIDLDGNNEVLEAEAFSGIGFYARPPATGGKPEAIIINVGDARVPIIVASRDEKTAAAVRAELGAGKPGAGETIVFSRAAIVYLKADGTVEIKTPGGTAAPLATLADIQDLRTWVAAHTHVVATTGTSSAQSGTAAASTPPPGTPAGTTVLRGQ